ncbi:MAG: tetratricopeptide repeat protein, partial [Pyrinomonadaceae bacterium]
MKNKHASAFIFVFLTALTLAPVIVADGQGIGDRNRPGNGGSATISGKVTMPDGTPAKDVKVSISSADINTSTFTDADGMYSFGDMPGGNYTVTVKVEGLPMASESYSIDADTPAGRTITLPLFLRNPGQKKGDFNSANPMLKDVPKAALDQYKKAVDKLQSNDAKGSIPFFDAAIAAYPNFAAAYYERGSAFLKENELDKALESFVKAIQIKSDYVEAKYSVGYTQYLKNNFEVAAAVFDDVLRQKDMPEAQLYLGISLAKIKNMDAAIPHFKAAIAAKDDESMALA